MSEIWKPIPGHTGYYEVSSVGRVRSVDRVVETSRGPRQYEGKLLRPHTSRKGYGLVVLAVAGVKATWRVHRLVALAFHGESEEGQEVRHLDGDPSNNHVENLRWGTRSENMQDAARHGTLVTGENSIQSKLCKEQVREIRMLYSTGEYLQRDLATMFAVGKMTICNILARKTWRHI